MSEVRTDIDQPVEPIAPTVPEAKLNRLLRAVDWRFLLRQDERPRALVLGAPRKVVEGVELIADPAGEGAGDADLVVIGFPTRRRLRRARRALRPDGELVCYWRWPRILPARRARARLRRGGFEPESVHWPGPHPARTPEFWLPLGEPAAAAHLFGQRAPRSRSEAALRRLIRVAVVLGLLVPVCAVAARGTPPARAAGMRLDSGLNRRASAMLLTDGSSSSCKVVGIPLADDGPGDAIVKYSRVAKTDTQLTREEQMLQRLAADAPGLDGVPRPRGVHKVAGRIAMSQSALHGQPLNSGLTQADFVELAPPVTERLLALARSERPEAERDWRQRLIEQPLKSFEHRFGTQMATATLAALREEVVRLPEMRPVWEHRDCGVWNIIRAADGEIGIHDWEFAEPRGLPGCDLAFFLATAAFEADGVLAGGAPDPGPIRASHARLLDPTSATGAVAARCFAIYATGLGITPRDLERLRLLTWIVQALGDQGHSADGVEAVDSLRASVLVGFLDAEIRHIRMQNSGAS